MFSVAPIFTFPRLEHFPLLLSSHKQSARKYPSTSMNESLTSTSTTWLWSVFNPSVNRRYEMCAVEPAIMKRSINDCNAVEAELGFIFLVWQRSDVCTDVCESTNGWKIFTLHKWTWNFRQKMEWFRMLLNWSQFYDHWWWIISTWTTICASRSTLDSMSPFFPLTIIIPTNMLHS